MTKHLITFEVDGNAMFDMVSRTGDGGSAIGLRLVEALLVPNDLSFTTAVGMGVYGIVLTSVEPSHTPQPTDEGGRTP